MNRKDQGVQYSVGLVQIEHCLGHIAEFVDDGIPYTGDTAHYPDRQQRDQ